MNLMCVLYRLMVLATPLAMAGCGDSAVPDEFVGQYDLISRNDRPLPSPLPLAYDPEDKGRSGCQTELRSSVLTIRSNGTYSERLVAGVRCTSDGSEPNWNSIESVGVTRFMIIENGRPQLVLDDGDYADAGLTFLGTMKSDELHGRVDAPKSPDPVATFVYRKSR